MLCHDVFSIISRSRWEYSARTSSERSAFLAKGQRTDNEAERATALLSTPACQSCAACVAGAVFIHHRASRRDEHLADRPAELPGARWRRLSAAAGPGWAGEGRCRALGAAGAASRGGPGRRRRWRESAVGAAAAAASRRGGGDGALEAVRAVAHQLQGAAAQPPGDLGHGAGLRPGADTARRRPALPAAQQPPQPLHQPQGDQPAPSDVPGEAAPLCPRSLPVSVPSGLRSGSLPLCLAAARSGTRGSGMCPARLQPGASAPAGRWGEPELRQCSPGTFPALCSRPARARRVPSRALGQAQLQRRAGRSPNLRERSSPATGGGSGGSPQARHGVAVLRRSSRCSPRVSNLTSVCVTV